MQFMSKKIPLKLSPNSVIIQAKEVNCMMTIVPISDLKNYSEVLSLCDDGSPICLTGDGCGKYVIQSLVEYEKLQATVRLLAELSNGIVSLKREESLTIDEAFAGLED
jgi:PHD/YefM family antitoxin component YafN of YafNO toxin-antitoxin module